MPTEIRGMTSVGYCGSLIRRHPTRRAVRGCSGQAELRERQKRWKEADRRLGYSAVAALEQELAEEVGVLGRVLVIAPFSSAIEIA